MNVPLKKRAFSKTFLEFVRNQYFLFQKHVYTLRHFYHIKTISNSTTVLTSHSIKTQDKETVLQTTRFPPNSYIKRKHDLPIPKKKRKRTTRSAPNLTFDISWWIMWRRPKIHANVTNHPLTIRYQHERQWNYLTITPFNSRRIKLMEQNLHFKRCRWQFSGPFTRLSADRDVLLDYLMLKASLWWIVCTELA